MRIRDRDGKNSDPESGMENVFDPGSGINIPDPQYCMQNLSSPVLLFQ